MKAYGKCLSATSSAQAAWYIVPADDKENARLIVSQVILETMATLEMRYPRIGAARRQELAKLRRALQG